MPNEKEVKDAARQRSVCSVTGRDCGCGSSGRCESRLGDGKLDPLPDEALRWAKCSLLHLSAAEADLDLALSACPRTRQAPEFAEAQRLIVCIQKLILERV